MDYCPTTAEIEAWPLASVEHFDATGLAISAAAQAPLALEIAQATVASLVQTARHRLAIVCRACKGDYDQADQESSSITQKIGSFEAQMNQLEPFLIVIVEANEQAHLKIKAQALEISDLSTQLADANKVNDKLICELSTHAVKPVVSACDSVDAPHEMAAPTQALVANADSCDASTELAAVAEEIVVSVRENADSALNLHSTGSFASLPVDSDEVEESEDDASIAGDDQEDDDTEDLEAFQQYVLLEDEDTKQWTVANKDANASAFTIVSAAITSDMVGCGPDGLFALKTTELSPQLLVRLEDNKSLLLVGASEDDIANLPLDWFASIDPSKLSVLERRAICIALLTPALMFWQHEFSVCAESAHKYMWFRQQLDALMDLTEEDETAAQEQNPSGSWSDVDYLAATGASSEICSTKDDDSDVSTTSEDEE